MWDLIVSVPDHCLSFYFASSLLKDLMETWTRFTGLQKKMSTIPPLCHQIM